MGFLGKLFGLGGRDAGEAADPATHFYVKSDFADEIIDVRVDPHYELVAEFEDEGDSVSHYFARKEVIGIKSFRVIDLHLVFDRDRRYAGEHTIKGGSLVDRSTFEAWKAVQEAGQIGDTETDSDGD